MHMGISVSMHGWAILFGLRTIITLHHLPSPHLPPNSHHLHLPLCHPQVSRIMPLPDGNDPLGDFLASSWAQGAHLLTTQQSQHESKKQALPDDNKTKVKGSPFCPDNSLPQGWLSRQVVPSRPPPSASYLASYPSRHPRQPIELPSPF
jgi:hypothetical protein